jgi:hypothetical protein
MSRRHELDFLSNQVSVRKPRHKRDFIITRLATAAGRTIANLPTELITAEARKSRKRAGKHIKRD